MIGRGLGSLVGLALCAAAALTIVAPPAGAAEPLDSLVAHDLSFAQQRLDQTAAALPVTSYPNYTGLSGAWVTTNASFWTSGFFPGQLWLMYEATGDPKWRQMAESRQAGIEPQDMNTTTHDLGFMVFDSFGAGYRLTGDDHFRQVVLKAAGSLATRYSPTVRAIRSWNNPSTAPVTDFRVIVDGLMNLELLRWTAGNGGDSSWASMADNHALRTTDDHVRNDGSTYHVVIYDSTTGAVKKKTTAQGYSAESTWSRGQAWAIYGFTQAYGSTRDSRFLDAATRTADWFVSRLPADKVPYWDFDAPGIPNEPRDSSAAAIAASALLQLSQLPVGSARASTYLDTAEGILTSLSSSAYLAEGSPTASILRHGTANKPGGIYDTGLIYGDYYFIEALLRYRALYPGGACAAAGAKTWTGATGDGRWSTAGNWSPAGAPTASSSVCIPRGVGDVVISDAAGVASIEAHSPIHIIGGGLTIADTSARSFTDSTIELSGGALAGPGALNIASGGAFDWDGESTLSGPGRLSVAPGAELEISDARGGGRRRLDGGYEIDAEGAARWSSPGGVGAALDATGTGGGKLTIGATLSVEGDAPHAFSGAAASLLHVAAGGVLWTHAGTPTRIDIPVQNDGKLLVDSQLVLGGGLANYSAQTLTGGRYDLGNELALPGAAVRHLAADVTLRDAAARIADAATGGQDALRDLATVDPGGRLALQGGAGMATSGDLANAGTVSLGSADTLNVGGAYSQAAGGTYEVAIAGLGAGRRYGQLVAASTAALDGTMSVLASVAPSAVPSAEIVRASAVSGRFGTVTGATGFTTQYGPTTVALVGEPRRSIFVTDAWTVEGDSGSHSEDFTVSLSAPSSQAVTVRYVTANGTATSGSDYTALPSTTLKFASGETQRTVRVNVSGDTTREPSETYQLKLSSASSNATISDASGTGTIVSDEGSLYAYVTDASVVEGNSGTQSLDFTVSLSAVPAAGQVVTVKYATADSTARTSSADYTAASGSLSFDPSTGATRTVHVPVTGDAVAESNEILSLKLTSATGAVIGDSSGTGTIVNDDGTPGPAPKNPIYVGDAWTLEGDSGSHAVAFPVTLDRAPAATTSVQVATADSTAQAGRDYLAVPATTLTWAPGDPLTKTVVVTVNGDSMHEPTETNTLKLASPSANAVVADASGTGTIGDEEGPLVAYVGNPILVEGDSGSASASFPVWLSAAPAAGQSVTVKVATGSGTATEGADYTALPSTTLAFDGSTGASRSVDVPVLGDRTLEPNETFPLTLSSPVGGLAVGDSSGTATIFDDD